MYTLIVNLMKYDWNHFDIAHTNTRKYDTLTNPVTEVKRKKQLLRIRQENGNKQPKQILIRHL